MGDIKLIKELFISALLAVILTLPAHAAFSLSGTRFIYEENKKSISFEVTNNSQDTYGGQVWIDNISQNISDVFMIPSPPFFKIDGGKKQVVRLMNVNNSLPKHQESLFILNVQEIPPKPKGDNGNIMAIAMNTRVKLIYRPKTISENRENAEKQISLVERDGSVWVKNPTPYYFAIISLKSNGDVVKLPDDIMKSLGQMPPNSEVNLKIRVLSGKVSVDAINDWGAAVSYVVR